MLLIAWILLVWPPGLQDIIAGILAAVLVTLVMKDMLFSVGHPWFFRPDRLLWGVGYVGVLAWYVLKANIDVAYRVLHPDMPIRPGIVKVKTGLKTQAGITALANSITLTPGTLTVNASLDGTLYVHWINVGPTDVEGATECIVSRFEWFLKRIFE